MPGDRFTSFQEFWPHYVREHGHPVNRLLHFIGTSLALFSVVVATISQSYFLFILTPILGYGFAWMGHFFVEKNRPASFAYPFWSFCGDFKMFSLMLRGRMNQEMTALTKTQ